MDDVGNDSYLEAILDGQKVIVPRGDMSDSAWEKLKADLTLRGSFASSTDRSERPAPEDREKPAGGGDHIEVYLGGATAIIPRGDMDDDAWKQVIARARDTGIFKSSQKSTSERDVVARDRDGRAFDKKGGRLLDFDRRVPREDAEMAPGESGFDVGAPTSMTRVPTQVDVSVGEPARVPRGGGGGLGGMVRGAVSQSMLQAAPADQFTVPMAHGADYPQPPVVYGPQGQTYPGPTANAGALRSDGSTPIGASMDKSRDAAIAAGNYVSPWGTPPQGQPMVDEHALRAQVSAMSPEQMAANMPPKTAVDPKQVQMSDPAGNGDAAGFQLPTGVRIPGDSTAGIEAQIAAAIAGQKKAIDAFAEVEGHKAETIGKMQQAEADRRLQSEKEMNAVLVERRSAQESAQQAYMQTVDEMGKIQKIDPNRLWTRMETPNKILAGVGILLGGVGAGTFATLGVSHENTALKIIRDAIADDVRAQQADVTNRQNALGQKAAGQRTAYDMLRQRGLDEYEAFRASEAARIDTVKLQIDSIANQMGSEEAKAKAGIAIAALDSEKNKLLMDVYQHRDKMAIDRAQLQLQNQRNQIAATAAAAKGAHGTQLNGPQVETLSSMQQAIDQARQMRDEYKRYKFTIAAKGTKYIPGTDAFEFDDRQKLAAQTLGKKLEGGKMTDSDRLFYLGIIPRAGTVGGEQVWDNLVERLERDYLIQVQGFQAAGFNAAGAPAVGDEDFEADE